MSPQQTIAHYRIVSRLGQGGMGEVWLATDTRLGREVAIKVLPDTFAADPERVARFGREAHVLGSLNHPNIGAIYGLEERALVLELVPGPTLAERLEKGPIAPEEALRIAGQIADALEYAHDRGIVHRDLKPANIKITPEGRVKLLDFGLARAMESPGGTADSATRTISQTQTGAIIGTVAYMSPEQARGNPVDRRADIWAFGAVMYEMLTGAQAFAGSSIADILAAVVTRRPSEDDVPPQFRRLVRSCLEKDPADRLRHIGDWRLLLEEASPGALSRRADWRWIATAAGLGAALIGLILWSWMRPPQSAPGAVARFTIPLAANDELADLPAISPDGRTIAYLAFSGGGAPRLFLRDVGAFESREVVGAAGAQQPFFSPDSQWVGFFARGDLFKSAISGGAPIRVAAASFPFGGTWTEDGWIVYVPDEVSGLLRVSPNGGAPERLTRPDGADNGFGHIWPQALPGSPDVLFSVRGSKRHGCAVLSMASRQWQIVLPGRSGCVVGGSGSSTRLFVEDAGAGAKAGAFDMARRGPATADTAVLANVYSAEGGTGLLRIGLSVSRTGNAVYIPGNAGKRSIAWVDRDGHVEPAIREEAPYMQLVLSPDGTRALVLLGTDLWLYELATGARRRITFHDDAGTGASSPMWSRDGKRIFFSSNDGTDFDIYAQPADGSRSPEPLLKRPFNQYPGTTAPDGTLVFGEGYPDRGEDLYALAPDGRVSPVRESVRFSEVNPQFSPDGRWLAYQSDESGRPEIYVESWPAGGRRSIVSNEGGIIPMWSRDGTELFYVSGDAVVVAPLRPDGSFGPGRKLFARNAFHFFWHSYDPAPTGSRLLMIHRGPEAIPRQLNVILNWGAELDKLVPTK